MRKRPYHNKTNRTNKQTTMDTTATETTGTSTSSQTMVRLRSMPDENGESKVFEISLEALSISQLLLDLTECKNDDDGEIDDDEDHDESMEDANGTHKIQEIDLPRVKGNVLSKVVDYLNHYNGEKMKEIPKLVDGSTFEAIVTQEWYQRFASDENLEIDTTGETDGNGNEMLLDLANAGNYLGIEQLLDLLCLKVTFSLVGKNQDQIRTILNLPEMTEADEKEAKKDHPWIFEHDKDY